MIKYNKNTKMFYLTGKSFCYAFFVNGYGYLQHLHTGGAVNEDDLRYLDVKTDRGFVTNFSRAANRMESLELVPLEYPFFGTGDYRLPAFLTCGDMGSRIENLTYKSHSIFAQKPEIAGMPSLRGGETLQVILESDAIEVALYYTVYEDLGALARRAEIKNKNYSEMKIERAASMVLDLYGTDYDMITLWGKHAGERHIERAALRRGIQSVQSTRGASSHQYNPFIALCKKNTDEQNGGAIGINYIYGGNFCLSAECDYTGNTRVFAGFGDFDFCWTLQKGETFYTPETVLVYSENGLGQMSRNFHDLYRQHLINKNFVNKARPVVINNWEATYFDFDESKLFKLIDSCNGLGIDTFVLDDGWFGRRDSDTTSLGDWTENLKKLPGGLAPVIRHCKKNGMDFGLWFEPEMVSEDSDLFRAHPDWRLQVPGMPPAKGRDQYVLDLSRGEVVEYLKETVSAILKNNDIKYVKWDFNRHITDAYSAALPANKQQEVLHRYMLGFYDLAQYLTSEFPHILFEGCSGGGGRFDPSNLSFFAQYWASDNSDAFARTFIQYGTSMCYPLSSMTGHVSVCPNHQTGRSTPLNTRGKIASLCSFGYELDITKLSADEREEITRQTAVYKEISPLILSGDLFRLQSPFESNSFAFLVVSKQKDKALLTYMKPVAENNAPVVRLKLYGLDPEKIYKIRETGLTLSGQALINCGLPMPFFDGDFGSASYIIEECKK